MSQRFDGCFCHQGAGQPISVPDKNRLKASPGTQPGILLAYPGPPRRYVPLRQPC